MSGPVVAATGGVTPAQGDTTFGVMKSDIAAYFGMDRDPSKVELAGRFIRDVIDQLNLKQTWDFNLVTSSPITTSQGTSTYSIPSDFWKVYNARKSNDVDFQLDVMRQKSFDSVFLSQRLITGQPYIMVIKNTFRDGTVTLFPTPDGVHAIPINYYKLIAKPTSNEDLLDMPRPYQIVVKHGALAFMAGVAGDPGNQRYFQALFDREVEQMTDADEDIGDEHLRFLNVEEITARWSYDNVASRPRAYDLW